MKIAINNKKIVMLLTVAALIFTTILSVSAACRVPGCGQSDIGYHSVLEGSYSTHSHGGFLGIGAKTCYYTNNKHETIVTCSVNNHLFIDPYNFTTGHNVACGVSPGMEPDTPCYQYPDARCSFCNS